MDKKLLVSIGLSIATVWVLNQYMSKPAASGIEQGGSVNVAAAAVPVPGEPVKVPVSELMYKPLQLEVAFSDKKLSAHEEQVAVQTPLVNATFSTYGGALTTLDFVGYTGKNRTPLRSLNPKNPHEPIERSQAAFVVALETATPFNYSFVGKESTNGTTSVTFKAVGETATIYKTYTLYDTSYRCDLSVAIEPKNGASLQPRLFVPAPYVHELTDNEISLNVWNEQRDTLEKLDVAGHQTSAWYWTNRRQVFGCEDRYFAHAMVTDHQGFVQRAYVKRIDARSVSAIFEGPRITQKTSWRMSFYLGPKRYADLQIVDDRLPQLMAFGWLTGLCKFLLMLLEYLFKLIGNFGLAILALAVVLRLPFTPLFMYARKQMEIFQRYQPAINHIRTKYRQDFATQQSEMMRFYKEHNLSPATQMLGMVPQIMHMIILFGLYRLLNNSIDLYQAPLVGWIVDLSSKDPFYVLPIVMGITMIWQQQMMPMGDGKQRVMSYFISLVATVAFANFPAGLVLYWLINNILGIAEDYFRKAFLK